jgi:hypothetical protein
MSIKRPKIKPKILWLQTCNILILHIYRSSNQSIILGESLTLFFWVFFFFGFLFFLLGICSLQYYQFLVRATIIVQCSAFIPSYGSIDK